MNYYYYINDLNKKRSVYHKKFENKMPLFYTIKIFEENLQC
jgi:hypothetical protein